MEHGRDGRIAGQAEVGGGILKRRLIRPFRGLSLRQRFLVAPLLGVVVCSAITAAFFYESQRQDALLSRITERDLKAFNHYAEVFVGLTEEHTALFDLLQGAAGMDEEAMYERTKLHLLNVEHAVAGLQQALPTADPSTVPTFAPLLERLSASAQAYRKGVGAAVAMATVDVALAPDELSRSNQRFIAMNRDLVRLLELERATISSEIAIRVRESEVSRATIAFTGISFAALLFLLSVFLSRMLSRSIETQIGILAHLGAESGGAPPAQGSDVVERMTHAVAAFARSLLHLRESERRFGALLENVQLVSIMLDREGTLTYCNEYLLRLTGWQREEVIGSNWFAQFRPADAPDVKANFRALLAEGAGALHYENEIVTRGGERRLVRWNNTVLHGADGAIVGTASIGEDVTEQKRSETGIKRLNRVYAVLSGINTLIVRVRDADELYRESCRIAVEQGQFRASAIALVDRATARLRLVATAGAPEGFLDAIRPRLSLKGDAPEGPGVVAIAVGGKKAVVINDVAHDPRVLRKRECLEHGILSLAVLPLLVSGEAVGVFALFGSEAGYFDEAEMALLTELAGDIAFAMDHIEKAARLDYLAYYDVLTGLANRGLFLERAAQYIRSAAGGGHRLALALIDVERFKNINDSLGRPAGDDLLKQVGDWLARTVGDASLVARVGADHFALVMPKIGDEGQAARLVEESLESFMSHPFRLNDAVFRIAAKVGIALFPDDGADADTVFKNAEAALKNAKASGERYLFHAHRMTEAVAGKLTLENQLRQALEREEFVLHYQPKVSLATGKVTSAEALIRWNDPRTGLVPPGKFIPVLEETGLIYEVGRWALRRAIADYLAWRAAGLTALRIAVNVSPLQLRNRAFIGEIAQTIGIDPHAAAGLELEITESVIMEDARHSIATLQAIREMGVTLAIDDFGTGFSSLSYLAKLPVDTLKIDRSFVVDMTSGPEGLALVSTIIKLAHSLKLKVVAEGVETEDQSRLLRLLGCDEMQGYLFSKPVARDTFEARFLRPLPGANPEDAAPFPKAA